MPPESTSSEVGNRATAGAFCHWPATPARRFRASESGAALGFGAAPTACWTAKHPAKHNAANAIVTDRFIFRSLDWEYGRFDPDTSLSHPCPSKALLGTLQDQTHNQISD